MQQALRNNTQFPTEVWLYHVYFPVPAVSKTVQLET